MMQFLRILLKLAVVLFIGFVLFTALMFAAKIWGVYFVAPSEKDSKGATLILTRYEDEPFLNASDRPLPPAHDEPPPERTMFGTTKMEKKTAEQRKVMKFPFIKFLHDIAIDTTSSK